MATQLRTRRPPRTPLPAGDPATGTEARDATALRARVSMALGRWPAVGFAAAVVRKDGLTAFEAHGVADVDSMAPVTQDTIFRIASISKTFTAIAVMQLWEEGRVDLDAPVNEYLRAFKLVPARPDHRPATLRHLLTHTAGVPEQVPAARAFRRDFGESFVPGSVPALAEYYGGALHLEAEPGTQYIYGDHSPSVAGQVVEDVTGVPLERYVRERIFEPLGMVGTTMGCADRADARLARGYTIGRRGATAVTPREWVTRAAAEVHSTPCDLARYVAALLDGGANQHGRVLQPATLAMMFEPQYRPDERIGGMGLAFFRAEVAGHTAVEHLGVLPGYNAQIFAVPGAGVGVVAMTNGGHMASMWLKELCASVVEDLLGAEPATVRVDVPHHPELWGDLLGWYKLSAGALDTRVRTSMGLGAEVFVRRGRLMLRFLSPVPALYRGWALHPDDDDDPCVFRVDFSEFGMGAPRVVFGRVPGQSTRAVHLDLMPVSLHRQPDATNPRRAVARALGSLAIAAAAIALRRRAGAGDRRRP